MLETYTLERLEEEGWTRVSSHLLRTTRFYPLNEEFDNWCREHCEWNKWVQFGFDWYFKDALTATAFVLKFGRN